MSTFQAVRGMRDLYGAEMRRVYRVRRRLEDVIESYGYEPIQLPLLEATTLFSRGVGEATDIVEKEMYTFEDRGGDSITLRPEGTASCVRALLQHGLLHNQTQRVFYGGPMFRYERPQKGRYRQFDQLGAEAFGMAGPDIDAELIHMGKAMWDALGVTASVRLEVNTLGSGDARQAYRAALLAYLQPYEKELDEDSRRRMQTNPLRILDSKVARTQEIVADAPVLVDFVDDDARSHFDGLKDRLERLGVPYVHKPTLVRGLDYYTHTVFEWVTDALGAQGTICSGGRYDNLVERLGGKPSPGVGFALGLDRVVLLAEACQTDLAGTTTDIYCCVLDEGSETWAMEIASTLRATLPGLRVRVHAGGGRLKNQLRKADQSEATFGIIIGDEEARERVLAVKWLRDAEKEQQRLTLDEAVAQLTAWFRAGREHN